jgi:PAS domain-containing protein
MHCRSTSAVQSDRVDSGVAGKFSWSGKSSAVRRRRRTPRGNRSVPDRHGDRLHAGITMSTPPDFSEHQSDQTARCPATPDGYLRELPALIPLDRLAVPMLAVRLDGVVFYANPAFAAMLGHQPDTVALIGQRLPELMAGHSATPPRDCVTALRAVGTVVVEWLHAEGFPVRSVISETAFVRGTDQILLIGVTDVTDLMWSIQPDPR